MEETEKRLQALEVKIDAIYDSAEKTRKYIRNAFIITVLSIVIPLIALGVVIPIFLKSLDFSGLGL